MLSLEEFTNGVVGYFSETEVTKHAFTYGEIKVDDVPEKYKKSVQNTVESISESFNNNDKVVWQIDV